MTINELLSSCVVGGVCHENELGAVGVPIFGRNDVQIPYRVGGIIDDEGLWQGWNVARFERIVSFGLSLHWQRTD